MRRILKAIGALLVVMCFAASVNATDLSTWFKENNMYILQGMYVVGKDIKAGNYKINYRNSKSGNIEICVFDCEEDYLNAYESNFVSDSFLIKKDISDSYSANCSLLDGNVLVISSGMAELSTIDYEPKNSEVVSEEAYYMFSGTTSDINDVPEGTYIFTSSPDSSAELFGFKSESKYMDFLLEKDGAFGSLDGTMQKHTTFHYVLESSDQCYVNLNDGAIIELSDGLGVLYEVSMGWRP